MSSVVSGVNRGLRDNFFRSLAPGYIVKPVRGQAPAQFPVDIRENAAGYVVTAELPGVGRENIDVQVNAGRLTISATMSRPDALAGESQLRCERHYGSRVRNFRLGADVDQSAVAARYADGVLTLQLPKLVKPVPVRLAVE